MIFTLKYPHDLKGVFPSGEMMKRNNILDLVGQTPIVPIARLNPHKNVKIYVKIESFNPGALAREHPGRYFLTDKQSCTNLL
jgi:cysteine synthase